MNPIKKICEVSEITKIDEGTSYLQGRIDVYEDGSKRVLSYGREVVMEDNNSNVPRQGDLTPEQVVEFCKGRVDADIEVVYSEVATKSENQDGSIPAPKADEVTA